MMNKDIAQIADKRFGQNFLKSDLYLKKIIQAMPDDELAIVEIGPGLGDLTNELARVRNVTAFEVDKRLCEHLRKMFAEEIREGRFELHCGDVLERWGEGPLRDEPYHLVANLPYYIATRIILKALKDPNCRSILAMVQKEVAEKFSAQAGEKEFSALSVLVQSTGRARILFEVGPEAFVPPPKVTSAVLSIEKDRSENDEAFESLLRTAFRQPRKKLSKNLSSFFSKSKIADLFESLGLNPDLRPHEAETSIYHRLYQELKKDISDGQQSKQQSKRRTKTKKR